MTYTLNDAEQKLARYIAVQRRAANVAAGVVNQRRGPQSDDEVHLEGVGAEIAFCHLFNVYPDLTTEPRRGGHDAVWCGWRVDVKATRYATGSLLATPSKTSNPCDLYALMVGAFPTYDFKGLATGADLFAAANVRSLGHGPTYALPQAALLRIATERGEV